MQGHDVFKYQGRCFFKYAFIDSFYVFQAIFAEIDPKPAFLFRLQVAQLFVVLVAAEGAADSLISSLRAAEFAVKVSFA